MIFTEAQLDGVSYETSTAENDGIVWNDRGYKFSNLPSYLIGTLLFQVPHYGVSRGTVIKILVYNPSTIYIAHEDACNIHAQCRSGGFESSLTKSGWTLVTENGGVSTGCCTFKYIWKKVVSNDGPTTITLPGTTTGATVHSIFIRGNSFEIIPGYETTT